MGRVRAKWIKNVAEELVKRNPDDFDNNFENNKKILEEMKIIDSKLMRNKIAGYIVTTVKKKRF